MGSELRASACLTLEMILLPIKLRVTAASALQSVSTVFRREIDSQRQWGYGTCYGDCFPAVKECSSRNISATFEMSSIHLFAEFLWLHCNRVFYCKNCIISLTDVRSWVNVAVLT